MAKQESHEEVSATHDVGTAVIPAVPMDGGLLAWLQVLGSWILFMNTWGLTNSYGVFQTYYVTTLLPNSSASAIAWIGSIQLFLTMIVGICVGWLLDAGYLRLILILGTVFEVFGMMMTSISREYWQILLAQGICTGIGSGLLGLTSVAVIPLYFQKRRMIATGIAATGSSLAGIIYPIMLQRLFASIGFDWAVRALAFLVLGCLLICIAVMRLRERPAARRRWPSLRLLADKPYAIFVAAFALMIMSVYVPFFYIQDYALELGISPDMAFYLLAIMNASSLFGRLVPNFLADYTGGITIMIPCCLLSALLIFLFRTLSDLPGLLAMAVCYGLVSGGMVSLPPAIIANLTDDNSQLGVRMGLGYTIAAFGALIGSPISGAAQRPALLRRPGDVGSVQRVFEGSWYFAGSIMTVCTLLLVAALVERRKLGHGTKI